jgi:hypothetical protein
VCVGCGHVESPTLRPVHEQAQREFLSMQLQYAIVALTLLGSSVSAGAKSK